MFIYSICIYENDDSYDFGSIVSSFLLLVDQFKILKAVLLIFHT